VSDSGTKSVLGFTVKDWSASGLREITPTTHSDHRGRFVKTLHQAAFKELGIRTDFSEEFYTVSARGTLRGLHFQIPPYDHEKLISCIEGEVLDVVVDLRVGSPIYGQPLALELSEVNSKMLWIPSGFAHGFYVRSDQAILMYKVTTVHSPTHDLGIHWNSIGFRWPTSSPILSDRDSRFPPLSEFNSPFVWAG
jgi:dTDP-4-dehydrorhamnose 3,5-epimerase